QILLQTPQLVAEPGRLVGLLEFGTRRSRQRSLGVRALFLRVRQLALEIGRRLGERRRLARRMLQPRAQSLDFGSMLRLRAGQPGSQAADTLLQEPDLVLRAGQLLLSLDQVCMQGLQRAQALRFCSVLSV